MQLTRELPRAGIGGWLGRPLLAHAMPAPICNATSAPSGLNVSASTAEFVRVLLTAGWPNGNASRLDSWALTADAPFTQSSRYFCCGTAQRARYACECLVLPRENKESWPTCEAHVQARAAAPCLVYSFGIAMQWAFDHTMADAGCEVHSFDPTEATRAQHEAHVHRGVRFHPWGLSRHQPRGCADEARRFSGGTYGNLSGPLLSLDRIVRRLGHTGRRITVLKVDCEGCEWDAFHHVATQAPSLIDNIDAIYIELHLALQMSTETDLVKCAGDTARDLLASDYL